MKDVIKLEAKLQLAVDLVQEVNLRFEELKVGLPLYLPAGSGPHIAKRLNRVVVDASVTPRPSGGHQQCPFF